MWFPVVALALAGLFFFGPLGALAGVMVGLLLSQQSSISFQSHVSPEQQAKAQAAFFRATFVAMGKIAKADGRINELEIQQATRLMDSMRLTVAQRRQAIEYFNQGKADAISLNNVLLAFKNSVQSTNLIQVFLEIQLQAAIVDGAISSAEKEVLMDICRSLNISRFTLEMLSRRVEAQQTFYRYQSTNNNSQQSYYSSSSSHSRSQLEEAYKVLGVSEENSDQEIKRAWRKLMSEHHPDKLVSKGLPKEMLDMAKRKTQEIQAAYDIIQKYRKSSQ